MRFSGLKREWALMTGLSTTLFFISVIQAHQPPKTETVTAKDSGKKQDDPISKIRDEGLNRSQVMKTALHMTEVLGPRLTNSPELKRANQWAADTLTGYGLQNAALDPWGPFGTGWTLKRFSAQVTQPVCIPLIGLPKAWSPGTNGPVTGQVVHLDATDEKGLEAFKGKLKGAIVLIGNIREVKAHFEAEAKRKTPEQLLALANAPEPLSGAMRRPSTEPTKKAAEATPKPDRKDAETKKQDDTPKKSAASQVRGQISFLSKRLQFLLDEGAAVMVETSSKGDGGTFFVQSASVPQPAPKEGEPTSARTRVSAWDKDAPATIPQIVVTVEHFNRLIHMLKANEKLQAEVEIAVEFQKDDLMGYNTVAEIPGTDLKDEVVMLGGHYDSWHGGTGATDNAAGCSVAMEAVRIIKALDLKPRRTIRVALWTGEEQGLYGSKGYVTKHFGEIQGAGNSMFGASANPSAPIIKKTDYDKFQVYFNLDNGSGKIRGVHLQGNEAARSIFRKWLHPFADLEANTITAGNTGGTDHLSFDAIGLPGFQFIQDEIEYDPRTHHSNMDVYDRLQADDLKQASTIMATLVWQAANMDEKFPRKTVTRTITTAEELKAKESIKQDEKK